MWAPTERVMHTKGLQARFKPASATEGLNQERAPNLSSVQRDLHHGTTLLFSKRKCVNPKMQKCSLLAVTWIMTEEVEQINKLKYVD